MNIIQISIHQNSISYIVLLYFFLFLRKISTDQKIIWSRYNVQMEGHLFGTHSICDAVCYEKSVMASCHFSWIFIRGSHQPCSNVRYVISSCLRFLKDFITIKFGSQKMCQTIKSTIILYSCP